MASISSLGIGSGVLNQDLVDKLVSAERKPADQRLNFNQQRAEALISAYGKLRSAVTELRLPMRQLSSADNLKAFTATSSDDGVGVTVDSTKASKGSYTVTVDSMARAQSLASGTFADKDTTGVGSGSLTLTVGGEVKTLTIDSSNNTLQGVANAINEAGVGATAGVIDTGSGFRLVLSAEETGVDNAVSISVTDDDGNDTDMAGLSQLSFDGTNNNLTETVAAQDASVQVNGITITRSNNTIENVVEGVTFELKKEGVTSSVAVSQDLGAVSDRVQAFVDKFNNLQKTIKDLAGFNAETGQGSLLTGDSTVRGIQNQLRQLLTRVVPGLEDASVRTLADVGITTDSENGNLLFDSAKFKDQLAKNPDDVTALFAENGRATDDQVEFIKSGINTEAGEYAVNISQAATRGSLQGADVGNGDVTIDADNDELTLLVDGETTASIQLTAGTYTREQLAAEIQARLDGSSALGADGRSVKVEFDTASNSLVFNSGKYGSESNVSLTAVDTNSETTLGLSKATGTAGKDVAGTVGGQAASGEGQVLFVEGTGPAAGMQIRVAGDATGARGSITYIQGVGDRAVDLVSNIVGADGSIEARTNGLQKELDRIAEDRDRLNQRIESYRDRLVAQFSAADSVIAQLNNTREFITQQLAALVPLRNRDR